MRRAKTSNQPQPLLPEKGLAQQNGHELAQDLLYGCEEIAVFLGWPVRRVRHAAKHGHIPASRSGAIYVGSKRRLREHFQGGGAEG